MTFIKELPFNHCSNLIVSLFTVENAEAFFSYPKEQRQWFLRELLSSVNLSGGYSFERDLYEGLCEMVY
jgi:hypothetical protein